jgi:hypothetical protein
MNLPLPWLGCCALLLGLPHSVSAADPIRLVSVEGRVEPAPRMPAVFGNREVTLDLEIESLAGQAGSLRADLFQVAGSLAMPLMKDLHLQDAIAFTGAAPQRLRVSMKFPNVEKQAKILVRLSFIQNASPSTSIPLGNLRFEVFPISVTKELTDLLQHIPNGPGPPGPIGVFGPGKKLRAFLSGLRVPTEDEGSGTPDRFDPNRLYFGELTDDEQYQQAQDRSAGARVVLFSPDETLPAGVYAERSESGVLIHVTSPLLDNLKDDPRAQLGFIKIIHFLSAPLSSAN